MKKLFIILCLFFVFSSQLNSQDVYQVNWTLEGTSYQAAIVVHNNSYGKARVKYLKNGEKTMVEESLSYRSDNTGFNLYGSNPVYPGTGIKYPNYSADNFLITVRNDGSLSVMVTDESLRIQIFGTSIQKITNRSDQVIFLKMFDWKL